METRFVFHISIHYGQTDRQTHEELFLKNYRNYLLLFKICYNKKSLICGPLILETEISSV